MLERYPDVTNIFGSFLSNTLHNLAIAGTYFAGAQTIQVDGTSYEELNKDGGFKVRLKEYESTISVNKSDIKTLNFSVLRGAIFEAAKKQKEAMNRDFIRMLESEAPAVQAKGKTVADTLLETFRIYKKRKGSLDGMQLISNPKMYQNFVDEMKIPANRERFSRELERIKNEKS